MGKVEKNAIKKLLRNLYKDERGQSTTEYILILSVVVMIAIKFKGLFSKQLDTMMGKLEGNMSEAIE